jgi:1,4-alpha-glucan branching enzyme
MKKLKSNPNTTNGHTNGTISAASATKRAVTAPAAPKMGIQKTELPKSNRISLELVKPDARQVFVAGSFNQWKPETTPLSQKGNGRWVGDVSVKPGRHEYLFVVDGQWVPDPNAKETVQNPFGGKNSVLIVSA